MSAGDEEHDVSRAWRIIERSGVMNHTYLDPSSRHVNNWCVVTYLHDYGLTMVQRPVSNDASTCTILRRNDTADVSTKVRVIDNVMR